MDILEEIRDSLVPNLYSIIVGYCRPIKDYYVKKNRTRKQRLADTQPVLETLNTYLVNNVSKMVIDYYFDSDYLDIFDVKITPDKQAELGAQDKYIRDKSNKAMIDRNFIEDAEIVRYSTLEAIGGYSKLSFILPHFGYDNYNMHVGYHCPILIIKFKKTVTVPKKLKDIIDSLELEVGGCRIDKIFGTFLEMILKMNHLTWLTEEVLDTEDTEDNKYTCIKIPVPFDIMMNNNMLITSKMIFHEARIFVNLVDHDIIENVSLEYEIYGNKKIDLTENIDMLIKQNQYQDQMMIFTSDLQHVVNVSLWFNHPIYMIYFCHTDANDNLITNNIVDEMTLLFNNHIVLDQYHKIDTMPGYYFIPFTGDPTLKQVTDTINFSRIDSVILKVKVKKNNTTVTAIQIHIGSVADNVVRYAMQLMGLRYSS